MKNDITKFLSCKLQIACWLVALFILLMIGFRSCSLRKDVVHHTYVYQPLNVDSLSKPPFLLRVRSDSVLTQLDSRVSQLETARDRDIDGVRQEVQNQINLISSWISIWLALIGFSGVLIPLAFQLKLRRDDEKKMQKTVAELQKKSDEVISKMKETVAELKKEVEEAISGMDVKVAELQRKSDEAISKMKETLAEQQTKVEEVISGMDKKEAELRKHNEKQLEDIKNEFAELQDELKSQNALSRLHSLVENQSLYYDDHMQMESEGSIRLNDHMYERTIDLFKAITEEFSKVNSNEEDTYMIMRSLVLIHSLVTKRFIESNKGCYKREADNVRHHIKNLFTDLSEFKSKDKADLQMELEKLIKELYLLKYRSSPD